MRAISIKSVGGCAATEDYKWEPHEEYLLTELGKEKINDIRQ